MVSHWVNRIQKKMGKARLFPLSEPVFILVFCSYYYSCVARGDTARFIIILTSSLRVTKSKNICKGHSWLPYTWLSFGTRLLFHCRDALDNSCFVFVA